MPLTTLDTSGFLLTEIAGEWSVVTADFGDGFQGSLRIGDAQGTRAWSMKVDVLPDTADAPLIQDSIDPLRNDTRAQYLWRFFRRSKSAGNEPFWFEVDDPDDGLRRRFLASFVDNKITFTILCAKIYSTGLQLRQRRLPDVTSPEVIT